MMTKKHGNRYAASAFPKLLKKMGLAGFSFFFIKGVLWLLIPVIAHSTFIN